MSIDRHELATRVNLEELFILRPKAPGESPTRVMLLTKDLQKAVIDGPWQNKEEKVRFASYLRADLERFVIGDLMRVALQGRKLAGEDMRRLGRVYEVWEYKSGKSKSKTEKGIRVFGRFAGRNVFVATHWQWRSNLGDYESIAWKGEITRCQDEWSSILSNHPPHTGDNVDAYLSNAEDASLFY